MSEALSTYDPAGVAEDFTNKCLAAEMRRMAKAPKGNFMAVWLEDDAILGSVESTSEVGVLVQLPDVDSWIVFKYEEGYWRLVLERSHFVHKFDGDITKAIAFAISICKNWESPALTFAS